MADPRFFARRGPCSLELLARAVDGSRGHVIVHNDVDIGANTAIDRGSVGEVPIAHNVTLRRGSIIVAQVGVADSTVLEDHGVVGGQAGLSDHLKVGKAARVAARGGVMRDIGPGVAVGGSPTVAIRDWHRQTLALARLARGKRKGD